MSPNKASSPESTGLRCKRCCRNKKGCDRKRPCARCIDAGLSEDCLDEDREQSARKRARKELPSVDKYCVTIEPLSTFLTTKCSSESSTVAVTEPVHSQQSGASHTQTTSTVALNTPAKTQQVSTSQVQLSSAVSTGSYPTIHSLGQSLGITSDRIERTIGIFGEHVALRILHKDPTLTELEMSLLCSKCIRYGVKANGVEGWEATAANIIIDDYNFNIAILPPNLTKLGLRVIGEGFKWKRQFLQKLLNDLQSWLNQATGQRVKTMFKFVYRPDSECEQIESKFA